jgi:hypothetical protein
LKNLIGCSSLYVSALVWTFQVVLNQIKIQVLLHFINGLVEFLTSHYAEMLIQKGSVEPFDKTIALRSPDFGRAVFDTFQLQE